MACIGNRYNNRCGASAAATTGTGASTRERFPCCEDRTPAQQLYGTPCCNDNTDTCCDRCGCTTRNAATRNRFWPDFARPRWLSCDALYDNNRSCNRYNRRA